MNHLLVIVFAGCLCLASAEFHCASSTGFPKEVCYVPTCTTAIRDHIKKEFDAAFGYMYLGSYFAQETVDRPGLAKFLLESASEERGHAIQMLDYLNLRGIPLDASLNYTFDANTLPSNINYKAVLEEILNMEIKVTNMIYTVIQHCGDDFHGADVFTNPILDEQHEGVRKLQGAVRTFNDLSKGLTDVHGLAMAEYIFDRKLLSGEI